jgi:hypothetical protein
MKAERRASPGTEAAAADRLEYLAPLAVTAIFGLIHAWWLAHDSTALYWDMGRHGQNALRVYDQLTNGALPLAARLTTISEGPDPYYPPLYYWLSALPLALFGRSADAIASTGVLFAGVLNVSAFGIARRLAGFWAGVLACLVASSIPILFDFTHQVMLDFPLTAMVGLTLWLLCERPFDSLWRGALTGLTLGLGLLSKWTFPAFVAISFLYVLVHSVRAPVQGAQRRWHRWAAAALSAAVALAVALPWFLLHRGHLQRVREAGTHVPGVDAQTLGSLGGRLSNYARGVFENQMDLPSLCLLAIGLLGALLLADWRKRTAPVWLSLLSSVLAWGVFGKHHDVRYSMPQLAAAIPLIACAPAIAASRLGDRWRTFGNGLIAGWSAWVVFNLSFAPESLRSPLLQQARLAPHFAFHSGPPKSTPSENPVRALIEQIAHSNRLPTATFSQSGENVRGIDGWSAIFYAELLRVSLTESYGNFQIRSVAPPAVPTSGRWFPFDEVQGAGVELVENFAAWEAPGRGARGESLRVSMPLDAASPYHFVWLDRASEATLVVREDSRETAGVILAKGSSGLFLVRARPNAKTRVEVWGVEPIAAHASPADERAAGSLRFGIDLGLFSPQSALAPSLGVLRYSPKRDPRVLVAGPGLDLPPGQYRAEAHIAALHSLAENVRLEMGAAPRRVLEGTPSTLVARGAEGAWVEGKLEKSFRVRSLARGVELPIYVEGFAAGELEVRGEVLWLTGLEVLEKVVQFNPKRLVHRSLFYVEPRAPD